MSDGALPRGLAIREFLVVGDGDALLRMTARGGRAGPIESIRV
jgi:hypothetical protein